jgi:hypothetical protein
MTDPLDPRDDPGDECVEIVVDTEAAEGPHLIEGEAWTAREATGLTLGPLPGYLRSALVGQSNRRRRDRRKRDRRTEERRQGERRKTDTLNA